MQVFRLVGQYDSPFVRRVAVTLHVYGMPFTRNAISVFTDATDMARINPLVRIPSREIDPVGLACPAEASMRTR